MINLNRSTYYYHPHPPALEQLKRENDLRDRIEIIALEFPGYGYRRITKQLHREKIKVNHKHVLRIMRESSLLVLTKRHWINTTNSQHGFPRYPNLTKALILTAPNQLWVADITYIRIYAGFVYLAVILDAFSRKVVGYQLGQNLDTQLTLGALQMALTQRQSAPGLIHHSDQGVQYAAADYVTVLQQHQCQISMARRGNPYDNAKAESFIKTLKQEEVYLWEYQTYADVLKRIPFFIEKVYNQKRLHSALGYLPPNEFEATFYTKEQNIEPEPYHFLIT
jgi:transposase InsO family protein